MYDNDCIIEKLSNELLIYIFSFLSIKDICNLKETCLRFHNLIGSWDNTIIKGHAPLVTNQISPLFITRCRERFKTKLEKLRVESNWIKGKYKEYSYFHVKKKYMPWLHLDQKFLWFSRGQQIYVYKRSKNFINQTPFKVVYPNGRADVTKFQVKADLLVSGLSDGGVYLQSLKNSDVFCLKSGTSYTYSVDFCSQFVASAHRDNTLKIRFIRNEELLELDDCLSKRVCDRPWCVSFNDDGSRLAIGTSAISDRHRSVSVYDLERFEECVDLENTCKSCGTLDLKWDGPNIIWSCGMDKLKKWDLRVGKVVQEFEDPFHYNLYCLDYDYYNTVMVGTYMNGRVVLWDVRHKQCIQLFFMNSCRGKQQSSPVYSLAFDSVCLFAATDQNLNILNFDSYQSAGKDYKVFI
ncbi:F-box/WD repeat-containing protein 4 [Cylas formicarius]|uniref:F-box/WD repeat-containing protein 4 n=1 Tax=Cylas formicarius TaxID=197179 RepID=UPI002958D142|nr:F-box/WD repeat-containing protein 4 [Cylas formicarius]